MPERRLRIDDLELTDVMWEELRLPVDVAFVRALVPEAQSGSVFARLEPGVDPEVVWSAVAAALGGGATVVPLEVEGHPYSVALGALQDVTGRAVGLLGVGVDREPLAAARRRASTALALGALSALLLAIVLSNLLARRMTRPLQNLHAGALAIARGWAMLSYRTPGEFAERFAGGLDCDDPCAETAPGAYLRARGEAFVRHMSPERFLSLSGSIDRHDVDPARIAAPALLIGAAGDQLVPVEQMRDLAARLGGPATLHIRDSLYGHDMFLKEAAAIGELVAPFLASA